MTAVERETPLLQRDLRGRNNPFQTEGASQDPKSCGVVRGEVQVCMKAIWRWRWELPAMEHRILQ